MSDGIALHRKRESELVVESHERLDRRVWLTLLGLYVAQAIPVYLVAAAMPPIFRSMGVNLASIGSIGILMLPWILKFLWAPYVDRIGSTRFGRRRSWILPMQLISVTIILTLSAVEPADNLRIFFPLLMLLAICAATQDIATDGYAVEHLPQRHQALGNAIQGGSVAAGVLIGGSLTLFVYDLQGWSVALRITAGLSALCLLPVLLIPERLGARRGEAVPANGQDPRPSLRAFVKRPHALALLSFALVFRLPEGLIKGVEQAFLVDQGLGLSEIGLVSGGASACVGLGGSALAVIAIRSCGLRAFFWTIGAARAVCFLGYAALSYGVLDGALGGYPALIALSVANTFIRYMEIVGLYTAFMRFSSLSQAGTDFTFLSCANLFVYMCGSIAAGFIGEAFGYGPLFSLAFGLSVVGILLAMRCLPATLTVRTSQPAELTQ
ncbi:MFS transporter [Nisaea acidiphila]|uniref:MFS transporter n=1 Tax=Nisaea acidiphila TaxID=1862145 RepID=A0A9J7AQL6_9PROT|nr:MFS transporter [Nisaea acidiphila]UUX49527.1 MFS transporter [Nisaea acidiphila]